MFSNKKKLAAQAVVVCVASVVGLTSSVVAAQDIEEVVIEAERRDESTLDLTESIDAFDLEDLETQQIKGFADISNAVPGLTASPSGAQGLRFTLRGIGARDSQLGVESKVGLYVDGAFLGRASGLVFDIVDLERVEVLKGPQGFTFGRNAIGGTINLITAKANPEEFYAKLETKVGNYSRKNITGIVNLPVSDTFAVRASAFKNQQEGWVENTGLGEDWGGFDRDGFRVSARWFASETVTVDYSYDKADFETQPVYYQPQFREGETSFDTADYQIAPGNMIIDAAGSGQTDPFLIQTPLTSQRLEQDAATLQPIENSTTAADGHSLVVEWAWSDQHTFKFVGTHRTSDVNNTFNFYPNLSSAADLATAMKASVFRRGQLDAIAGNAYYAGRATDAPTYSHTGVASLFNAVGFEDLSILGLSLFDSQTLPDGSPEQVAAEAFYTELKGYLDNPSPTNFGVYPLLAQSAPYQLANRFTSVFASPPGGLAALKDHKQFSIELQQSGFFLDDRVKYDTGVYYFNERTGNGRMLEDGELYLDLVELLDFGVVTGKVDRLGDFGFSYISLNRLNTDALGAYGNVEYTPLWLDERLHLTFGLRYSRDDRNLTRQGLSAFTLQPRCGIDYIPDEDDFYPGTTNPVIDYDSEIEVCDPADTPSAMWESVDPRFKVAYDLTEDVTGYISVASGYRGGNFNVDAREVPMAGGAVLASDIRFEPESQLAYEFGFKGPFADGLVDIEFAAFYYDVKDGQETVIFPLSPISRAVVNADGFSFGVELDTVWHLTEELTLTANYALLRSGSEPYATPFVEDFSSLVSPGNPLTPQMDEYLTLTSQCTGGLRRPNYDTGQCLERKSNFGAPVNSWTTALDYRLPLDDGEFFFHLGYNYKDAFFVNDTLKVDARDLWDLRIQRQIDIDSGVVRVALWSQNLFDNEYQLQKFELNRIALDLASYGTPRTFGLDVIYEWF